MPEIGEIKKGKEIGKSNLRGKFLWSACKNCGKGRWVEIQKTKIGKGYCQDCEAVSRRKSTPTIIPDSNYIPKSGDIVEAKYIDFTGSKRSSSPTGCKRTGCYKWRVCLNCKKGHWISAQKQAKYCTHCNRISINKNKLMENSRNWKGGRLKTKNGYYRVLINREKDKQFWPMARRFKKQEKENAYVLEHRYIMAQHLGRCLESWEIVHHINGIKSDNRIENLELLQEPKEHLPSMAMQNRVQELEKRVTLLEAENALLKLEKQLSVT